MFLPACPCDCLCLCIQIGSGFIKAVYGGRHKLADLVPVDLTANALITIAWHNATHRSVTAPSSRHAPGRTTYVNAAYCHYRPIVAWSVCLSVTMVIPAETAEPIEMPFALWTLVGPRYHVLDRGPGSPCAAVILRGKGRPVVKYRDSLP